MYKKGGTDLQDTIADLQHYVRKYNFQLEKNDKWSAVYLRSRRRTTIFTYLILCGQERGGIRKKWNNVLATSGKGPLWLSGIFEYDGRYLHISWKPKAMMG